MPGTKDDAEAAKRVVAVSTVGRPRDSGHDDKDRPQIEMKLGS